MSKVHPLVPVMVARTMGLGDLTGTYPPMVVAVLELYSKRITLVASNPPTSHLAFYVVLDFGAQDHLKLRISRQAYERLGGKFPAAPADPRQLKLPVPP